MSDTTQHLTIPLVAAAQAQKHVTVNEAFAILDAVVQLSVADRGLAAPPGSPAEGDRYIVAASATGLWAGKDGQVTIFDGGAWAFLPPQNGWRAWIEDEGREIVHNGVDWITAIATSPNGAGLGFEVAEEQLILSGASVDSVIAIPDRAILFGVSTRTTAGITGASSYDCGIVGDIAKFGGTLNISAGSTNSGVIGPTAFYAATPIKLTANGGNFSAGSVRIAIHYMLCGVPAT